MRFLPSVLALRPLLGVQAGHRDRLLLALPVTVMFSFIRIIGLKNDPVSGFLKFVLSVSPSDQAHQYLSLLVLPALLVNLGPPLNEIDIMTLKG